MYQINEGMKRLLFVVEDRREKSLRQFFTWFGKERSALITFVCSDMWKPYLNVIARHAPRRACVSSSPGLVRSAVRSSPSSARTCGSPI
ncbi:hypothetical protein C4901_11440 [Acidiferrobacter sp. SPIII_3]|uniref:transposase n=1 Tax=Acidiferrobacter sp. SPIII_3 TaxID=1281578 RepID=UPI000D7252F1|nr:hypothetical protein C4901_11440 [Acidiferrobacter sp. SPIII_3]